MTIKEMEALKWPDKDWPGTLIHKAVQCHQNDTDTDLTCCEDTLTLASLANITLGEKSRETQES